MEIVEMTDTTVDLAEHAAKIAGAPIIVEYQGQPVAALAPVDNTDLETACLSTNPQIVDLIERSRTSV
ncbi:MAG: hypothetical protein IT364_13405 [Candidatus Hydrogenedentes bacterium]|nr:hypothetical protein [Candidatus Hydrogenedentota bacterium]